MGQGLPLALVAVALACRGPESPPSPPRPVNLNLRGHHGLLLAEAIATFTRAEVLAGQGECRGWRTSLLVAGYRDEELADGSEVLVRTQFFKNNAGGQAQETTYLVHRPPGLEVQVIASSRAGDLVEVEVTPGDAGRAGIGVIARVRDRRSGAVDPSLGVPPWSRHRYERPDKVGFEAFMDSINPSGGGQSVCITGDGLTAEGWICFYGGFPGGGAFQWWKPLDP